MDFSYEIETIQLLRNKIVSFSQSKLKKNNRNEQQTQPYSRCHKMVSEIFVSSDLFYEGFGGRKACREPGKKIAGFPG